MTEGTSIAELQAIDKDLRRISAALSSATCTAPLTALNESASKAGKAWSGSWLGYHSRIYYDELRPPPAGAHFSVEWGLHDGLYQQATQGDWFEFADGNVEKVISERAGSPDISKCVEISLEQRQLVEEKRDEIASILRAEQRAHDDPFLAKLVEEAEGTAIFTEHDYINYLKPSGDIISRDSLAVGQGLWVPPHISILAKVAGVRAPQTAADTLAGITRKAFSHLERLEKQQLKAERVGTNVFIGHGRSKEWKDLKDFISERMRLPWDEFNRVPVAGIPNAVRLATMLDAACIAFLVFTGEDEAADGTLQARMNVVHEAGLFQGRLGFTRAIVMLEEGCQEFSNIAGLGQVRFPKGNIKAAFHEVELVLEREGLSKLPGK